MVDAFEAERGVGQDRKERDDRRQDQKRALDMVEPYPNEHQRRDRHDGRDLQDHGIGEEELTSKRRDWAKRIAIVTPSASAIRKAESVTRKVDPQRDS